MATQRIRRESKEEMEMKIWSQLPDELLDRILAFLPVRAIVNLRSTCKRFNSLLLSPSFLSLLHSPDSTAAAVSSSVYLILSHPQFPHHSLPLYSSAAAAWHTSTLSSSSAAAGHLVSSSSGLLLFSLLPSSSLLVSNPLTASSRILQSPVHHHHPSSAATLVSLPYSSAHRRPHGYKIFLPSPSSNWVFLYDSSSRSWARFPGLCPAAAAIDGVLFAGSLYFTTPDPFSVVGFHLSTGRWDPIPAPAPSGDLAFVRLAASGRGDRLYLVGGVGSNGISRSLRVWEMVAEKGRWEEVGRLPEMMCRKFVSVCYHNYSHVYCIWHEGLVCVCCTTWPEVLFFKPARGTWHWLPRCPLLQKKWSCGFRWFSFVPDLYALV